MADMAALAPATHKQPSRKGKKAWRKNVDLTDVHQGLDTVRDEILQGGVITERDASQLFALDSFGDAQIEKQTKGKKSLKTDEILALRSAVPGLEGRKRKHEPVVPTSSKRQKDGKYVSHKELQRLKRVANFAGGSLAVEDSSIAHDPWSAPPPPKHAELDFIPEIKPVREPRSLKQAPVSLAANGKSVPAVRKPQGGKSYNPLVNDWSELLAREGEAAVEAEKARLKADADAEDALARAEAEAAKAEAAEREEWATDYESEWEGFQSEAEQPENFTQKTYRRKTPSERNKIKARKERERKERWEQKQKVRDEQVKMIKSIAKELSARDRAQRPTGHVSGIDATSSDSENGEVQLQRRRFGKVDVPEAPLEVVLPDELQDSLRRLKPEGNLLTDRYRNLLINGKMEVRKRRAFRKQAKTERTEKWSYKDWTLK